MTTRLPPCANDIAKLVAVVVFPSLGSADETAITLARALGTTYLMLVLNVLKASVRTA